MMATKKAIDKTTVKVVDKPIEVVAEKAPEEAFGEKQIYASKEMLAICGTAQTMIAAPFEDSKFEIWAVAQCSTFPTFKRADILFELHTKDYWADENVIKRLNEPGVINPTMAGWDGRLVMQDHYDAIPRSEKLPIQTLLQYRRYHRTSLTYMLALAYHSFLTTQKPLHVGMYGVHMEDIREEYAEQRPCCEYWLGRMEAAGMDIFIAGGAILAAPFLYGYEMYNPMNYKLRQRMDGLTEGTRVREQEELEKRLQKHEQIGAVKELEYWLRLSQRGELQWDSMADTEQQPDK